MITDLIYLTLYFSSVSSSAQD